MLHFAVDLCHRFSASLCIVSTLPNSQFNPLGMETSEIQVQEEKFREEQVHKLNQFLINFDFSGVTIKKTVSFWNSTANIILNIAEDFNYDLIVMDATGHSRLHNVVMGSTTRKVLRYNTPCSLLVVR
ncbi:universal stress protein [Candidatus Coxiella mudrowiae]|uniref:universal stress protein n=1 Tax=Candidatus Coxiella mudrowiae TaxID=2054173 RepID=UPI000C286038|nr:universal stress protein [Candidatus Coxiella mudrowiae]